MSIKIGSVRKGSFVDNPGNLSDEDELERIRDEAYESLESSLDVVKGRYYWDAGKSVMINMTLTGRPLFHQYTLFGILGGTSYNKRTGVLTINPTWQSERDSIPSYKWGFVVDKMIRAVKQSDRISDKIEIQLGKIEARFQIDIPSSVKDDIIKWCIRVSKRRLSVSRRTKGKEFNILR